MPPRHERPSAPHSTGSASVGAMTPTMASMDAKIKLLSQQMKILQNNVQVLSRTMVSYSNKISSLEKAIAAGGKAPDMALLKKSLKEELAAEMKANEIIAPPLEHEAPTARVTVQMRDINKALESLRQEVNELKYVVESINPLEYVTLDQLNDVIERKLEKRR